MYSKSIKVRTIRIIAKVVRPIKGLCSFSKNSEKEEILMIVFDSKIVE